MARRKRIDQQFDVLGPGWHAGRYRSLPEAKNAARGRDGATILRVTWCYVGSVATGIAYSPVPTDG